MANLPETPQWEEGIYQIEVSDPVLGGPDGISNRQGKQLASRTLYLKQQVEKGGSELAKHIAAADPHTQYAPKASPTFTGTPTAPTPANSDNSKKLATTEFVAKALAALAGSAPETLDTLKELADALGNDPNFATTVLNKLAEKLAKDQHGADIPDPALFVKNLGLTYFADKNSLSIQEFKGPVSSKDSVTATSADGTTRKVSLNAATGLQIVIYDGGTYRGGINIPAKSGTMALTSDLTNFADKSTADSQVFTAPLVSNDGIVAQYGLAKVILSAKNGLKLITYQNNQYTGGVEIPKRDGIMALSADLFGVSQTWQNVKASRSAGVTYTNSTGRPIAVSIAGIMASNQTGVQLSLAVNGVEASSFAVTQASFDIRGNVFAIVPPGATYNLTANSINSILTWSELR